MKNTFRIAVVAGALAFSLSAMAAFAPGMTVSQLDTEVQQRLQQGQSLAAIAADAKLAGVSPSMLTYALITQGKDAAEVVSALVSAGFSASSVVNAAVAAGASYKDMVAIAVAAGADPTAITPATAAGPGGEAGGAGTSGGSSGFGGGTGGFSGPAGGGGGSVSPS